MHICRRSKSYAPGFRFCAFFPRAHLRYAFRRLNNATFTYKARTIALSLPRFNSAGAFLVWPIVSVDGQWAPWIFFKVSDDAQPVGAVVKADKVWFDSVPRFATTAHDYSV